MKNLLIFILIFNSIYAQIDVSDFNFCVKNVQKDDILNVRLGPGTKYETTGFYHYNDIKIQVVMCKNMKKSKWCLTKMSNGFRKVEGWVNYKYIEEYEDILSSKCGK